MFANEQQCTANTVSEVSTASNSELYQVVIMKRVKYKIFYSTSDARLTNVTSISNSYTL